MTITTIGALDAEFDALDARQIALPAGSEEYKAIERRLWELSDAMDEVRGAELVV